ncbi:MAG: DUF1972 domain-containing protein [Chitinophagaceae bacterium]|jgi:glycosyltransferase involved in cell wall biosynthesis
MKIALLGTRGIPNHYGGFEQYAELLSAYLSAQGWDVTVYNSHNHPYQEKEYKGVKIRHIFDPEKKLGTVGQFLYDLGCILDTRKQKFDLVYQLGYTSSSIFNFLFPVNTLIVTNMDGMEWKRSKYNRYVQRFLMYAERVAVKRSNFLVADSLGIKKYLDGKYKTDAFYSAYTAEIPKDFTVDALKPYTLTPNEYNLLIARLEPENNIEMIIDGHIIHSIDFPLIIIGNAHTKYGIHLQEKYTAFPQIKFIGAVYDKPALDSIRHFSLTYFHGHSVGGTNPSLLEAMSCGCNMVAHDNIFNKSVLGIDALYFDNPENIHQIITNRDKHEDFFSNARITNLEKIKSTFSEEYIFNTLKEKLIIWQNKNAL